MLKAIVLVCALTGPCDESTAWDVIKTPVLSALPARCLMLGMAYIAGTEVGRDEGARSHPGRVIVKCVRA